MTEVARSQINVVSYNVLSSSLAKPSYHANSAPEHLDNVVRLGKLIEKMEKEIERESIITLQEVSERWGNDLVVFFHRRGYFSSIRNYGGDFNGYMGVLIAFPMKKYSLEQVISRRVSDSVYWHNDVRHEKFNDREYSKKTLKTLNGAQRRSNCVVMNQLQEVKTKKNFLIATYHMPCVFYDQKFMDIHAGLLVRLVQEAARGMPTILSGDFNSHQDSSAYKMITNGRTSSLVASMFHNHKNPDRISFGEDIRAAKVKKGNNKKGDKGKESITKPGDIRRASGVGEFTEIRPMRSAYKIFLKKEPGITNFSNRTGDKEKGGFASCIDYIFISEEFEVVDVEELYENRAATGSSTFPDEKELSDHVMLRATLTL